MRTYSRDAWLEAQELWADFSDEWRDVRHTMAMNGVLFPPSGTAFDSWEDDSPSQRAVLIRAIRETPALLNRCMKRATSWQQVIERLFRERDELRIEVRRQADEYEREVDRRRMQPIGQILQGLGDSYGVDR